VPDGYPTLIRFDLVAAQFPKSRMVLDPAFA